MKIAYINHVMKEEILCRVNMQHIQGKIKVRRTHLDNRKAKRALK